MSKQTLGSMIVMLRKEKGMTQLDLAKHVDITVWSFVGLW